jgi:hypothetical protein
MRRISLARKPRYQWQAESESEFGRDKLIGNYSDQITAERACVKVAGVSLHWINVDSKHSYANDPTHFYRRYTVTRIKIKRGNR